MIDEDKLLPIYDKLYDTSTLAFKGKMFDPTVPYESKLEYLQSLIYIKLSRVELAKIYYWLDERFKREQKSQREAIPNKYKSEEFKKYEKWEKSFDPARHTYYNSKRLTDQEIKDKGIEKPSSV